MNREQIYQVLSQNLQELFGVDPEIIKPEARLYEDLDIDSIDAVDLIVKMRQLTNKRIEPEMFKSVRTIDDVVKAFEAAQ
ncbi:acyl carrier protein [Hydromonas duriensis]|uniref:Acyl carrier protein n=1 Tax=Hydromonas duriensis TaxID=1527608 RepID=A0A4R6Y5L1_9BURK|nr:acyl carrier protein [Hydromonas duriensis]TDR30747.1 acyl carrier protein [Hydromonas duriensis]